MAEDLVLEKLPPQNIEAEMAVLGSMLIDEEAIAHTIETLSSDYFYKDNHRHIYDTILTLFNANKAVDMITVCDELKSRDLLDKVGGPSYIASLVNTVPTSANISHYSSIVREKATLRSLIRNSTQIISDAYNNEGSIEQLLDNSEKLIFEIRDRRQTNAVVPLKEIIKDSIEAIDKLYQKKAHVTGVPTGFVDFDIKTAGLQPSDLIIIAGRPSMGKSAFAIGIVEYASITEKISIAFFSLEMSKEQLVQRLLCSHARVDAHKVRTGFLAVSDWPKLTAAAGKLSEAAIFIDDSPAISAMEIRAKARRLKAQYDIKMVVVDYLQLMRASGRSENRQQEISEISRSLKALARELDVPVIAISQLSRAVESRTDHKPQLSDLRESGAIEQDADVVVLLLREEYYNPNEDNKGIAEINIAKQRNGPVGSFNLTFIREYTRFENISAPAVY